MSGASFKLNSGGVGELLHSSAVRAELTRRAEAVLSQAKADAPVATGAYRNGLHLVQDTTDRAVVRVASDVDYALLVEANTGVLVRALDSAR